MCGRSNEDKKNMLSVSKVMESSSLELVIKLCNHSQQELPCQYLVAGHLDLLGEVVVMLVSLRVKGKIKSLHKI